MNDITSFVERLYENVLGRNSDINGLNNWINTLQSSNAADVAKSFFNSQEFLNANYSNGEYIEKLYQTFMDRNSDIGGYNNWLNQLQSGVSRNSILDAFSQSQEFSIIAQNYGINAYDSNLTEIEDFVNRFYTEVLERPSDASGLESWSSQLENGTKTADDIANGFFFSQEFLNKNLNNSDFVDIAYQSLLGREADSAGKSSWTNNLYNGMSRSDMLDGFIYSDEFKNLANSYGIEVGVNSNEIVNEVYTSQTYFNNNYYSSETFNNLKEEVIDTQTELKNLYDSSIQTLTKSNYETTTEYNTRIEQFRKEKGMLTFEVELSDIYDADTQELIVYHWTSYLKNTLIESYSIFSDENIEINNFGNFPFFYDSENYDSIIF